MKKVIILGATGSIGEQTRAIIKANKADFTLVGVSGFNNFLALKELAQEDSIEIIACKSEAEKKELEKVFPNKRIVSGKEGLLELAAYQKQEEILLVNALVGIAGLEPTLKAISIDRKILLANKETLVVGGDLIKAALKRSKAEILPIDSEHSGLWQLLEGEDKTKVKRVVLTASGGAFRDKSLEELERVKLKEALKHPNWSMGKKITIDSATLINKGFEVIEACYLFDFKLAEVEAIIHHESLVHALIEFVDGSVLAQISTHDMRLAISYALYYPKRKPSLAKRLDLDLLNGIHFAKIDYQKYPCFNYALEAYKKGGSYLTVLNAANEVAVKLFLEEKIAFLDIAKIIQEELIRHKGVKKPSLKQILAIDQEIKSRIYSEY